MKKRGADERVFCLAGGYKGLAKSLSVMGLGNIKIDEDRRHIRVSTGELEIDLLKDRGLALFSVSFPEVSDEPLLGTLGHGYYDSIELGADFFSGHLIHTARDGLKSTDLSLVSPEIREDGAGLHVFALLETRIGVLEKSYFIPRIGKEFSLTYKLRTRALSASSLRLGIFTLIPHAFNNESLWFETINGGAGPERFYLKGHTLNHDKPVSPAISASGCLGATEGWVSFGDDKKSLTISSDRSLVHTVPMINYREAGERFFLRLYHSAGELDDTSYWLWRGSNEVTFTLKARRLG